VWEVLSRLRQFEVQSYVAQHYTLFPLALGQILREYAITELHLSLNAGKWNYDLWGPPDEPAVGTGAELWAWMGDGAPLSCVGCILSIAPYRTHVLVLEWMRDGRVFATPLRVCFALPLAAWMTNVLPRPREPLLLKDHCQTGPYHTTSVTLRFLQSMFAPKT
jgi:Gpi16 subunit, GPI transamidase component